MPEWLTTKQAAKYLNCSLSTIYRRIYNGELKAYKSGNLTRVKREDLDKLFEERQK